MGWDLGPLSSLSAEEQTKKIAEITNSISSQKAGTEKINRAKRVFGAVLSSVHVFGGFVAQGASVVRPSASKKNKSISQLAYGRYLGHHSKSSML